MKLMVVESPNKIKKLKACLDDSWSFAASVGHIRDLPRNELGITIPGFALEYVFIPAAKVGTQTFPGGEERLERISRQLHKATEIYLATDLDREGEAIAWHLKETLGLGDADFSRITFDEITKKALEKSLDNPRMIDYDYVLAQEARRALDRLYGYLVSPWLTEVLGLSVTAGRVQSVALRLVVELERRIKAFRKTKHFGAVVSFDGGSWQAEWNTKNYLTPDSAYILDQTIAQRAASCRNFTVTHSETTKAKRSPPSAFSTSLLLQAASTSLKLSPPVTSKLAQKLFEQGVITYIRTDGVNLSEDAISDIRELATAKGLAIPDSPRKFTAKGDAQGAHEGIRPTDFSVEDAGEDDNQRALYRLIWQRSVASQLADAVYSVNTVELEAVVDNMPFQFKAKGRTLVSPGWLALTAKDATESDDEEKEPEQGKVPTLEVSSSKVADNGKVLNKETTPPTRFTEATLVKKMEAEGIGRPATYSSIIQNITGKGYVVEEKRYLVPQEIGYHIIDKLVEAKFTFVEIAYTRELEEQLDLIANSEMTYEEVVGQAYAQLISEMEAAGSDKALKPRFPCPKCESGLRRYAAVGKVPFWFCSSQECKHVMDDVNFQPVERKVYACTTCNEGTMRKFKRKSGGGFIWACSTEECKHFMDDLNGKPVEPAVHTCPACRKSPLRRYQRKDKETGKAKGYGWFCTGEDCKTFLDDDRGKPGKTAPCPSCGSLLHRKKGEFGFWWGCSAYQAGCKTVMDDKDGKPVPKKPKVAGAPTLKPSMPKKLVLKQTKK
ncbi:type I DNA topoisomerase [Pseudomonas sp. LB3P58]